MCRVFSVYVSYVCYHVMSFGMNMQNIYHVYIYIYLSCALYVIMSCIWHAYIYVMYFVYLLSSIWHIYMSSVYHVLYFAYICVMYFVYLSSQVFKFCVHCDFTFLTQSCVRCLCVGCHVICLGYVLYFVSVEFMNASCISN